MKFIARADNMLTKKTSLMFLAGLLICSLIVGYNGLQSLAMVGAWLIPPLVFGAGLFFLKGYLPARFAVLRIRPIVAYGTLLFLNSLIFGGVDLVYGGDIASVFIAIGSLVIKTTGAIVILIIAYALGLFLLLLVRKPLVPEQLLWAFSIGLGLALLGLGTFVLALFQAIHLTPVLLMMSLAALLAWREIIAIVRYVVRTTWTIPVHEVGISMWFLWIFILLLLEIAFIQSHATLAVAGYDSFHQYLVFPTEYLRHGGIVPFLWHPNWGLPQLGEMIFLLFMVFMGKSGPFLVNYFLLLVFLATFFQVLGSGKWSEGRHWFLACMASSPILFYFGSGTVKIDLLLYFYCLLIFIVLKQVLFSDKEISLQNRSVNILLGILFGILLSFKYTALFIVAALFLALFVLSRERRLLIKRSVLVFGVAFLIFSPWLIKNWLVYRSPLYPLFQGQDQLYHELGTMCSRYFPQLATQDLALQFADHVYQTGMTVIDYFQIFLFFLSYPAGYDLFFPGIWMLLFLPIIAYVLCRRRNIDTESWFLLLFSGIFFLFWVCLLLGAAWYLFPAVIAFLLAVARQLSVTPESFLMRWWVQAVSASSLLLFTTVAFSMAGPIPSLVRYANGDIPLSAITRPLELFGPQEIYQHINTLLQKDESVRVYSFLDFRGYFIDNSAQKFISDFYGEKLRCFGESDEEIRRSLEQLNVGYVTVMTARQKLCDIMPHPERNGICRSMDRFKLFIERQGLQPIRSQDNMTLYAL